MDSSSPSGIILINKPSGLSSNQAVGKVKRYFSCNKVGHTGTLDPLATGMLPITLGHATKISSYLLSENKCYQAEITLGEIRDTDDSEGKILQTQAVPQLTVSQIEEVLQKFIGQITQIPPKYSALKYRGKPMYHYARKGISLSSEIKARQVCIDSIDLLHFASPKIKIEVQCSKGTYIRSLARDIGDQLGCGAYLSHLFRKWTSSFAEQKMLPLDDLLLQPVEESISHILPLDFPLGFMPQVNIDKHQSEKFKQGQKIPFNLELANEKSAELIRVYHNKQIIGLARWESSILSVLRLLCDR